MGLIAQECRKNLVQKVSFRVQVSLVAPGDNLFICGLARVLCAWLKTFSSSWILTGHYNHLLSRHATIMVKKNFPIIGEHVMIFVTQLVAIATI